MAAGEDTRRRVAGDRLPADAHRDMAAVERAQQVVELARSGLDYAPLPALVSCPTIAFRQFAARGRGKAGNRRRFFGRFRASQATRPLTIL